MLGYLGVDVGSVSTNLVVIDDQGKVLVDLYLRTRASLFRLCRKACGR